MDDRQYQKKLQEMRQRHELDKQVFMVQFLHNGSQYAENTLLLTS